MTRIVSPVNKRRPSESQSQPDREAKRTCIEPPVNSSSFLDQDSAASCGLDYDAALDLDFVNEPFDFYSWLQSDSQGLTPTESKSDDLDLASPRNAILSPACAGSADREVRFDSCFGVIIAPITSALPASKAKGKGGVKVSFDTAGDILRLHILDDRSYAGILVSPTIAKLLGSFSVTLEASLTCSSASKGKGQAKSLTSKEPSPSWTARIIVFGLAEERDAIGELLGDADVFLQHPTSEECARLDVPYLNPQLLLRPGAEMPSIESLLISVGDARPQAAPQVLDEVACCRFMRVFDSADGSGYAGIREPSPRLRASLEKHQLSALSMMSEKECGIVQGARFPCLWETMNRANAVEFRHRITGHRDPNPLVPSGGVLADEMGLGKTLSVIALICWSLDQLNANELPAGGSNAWSRSTLIVVPLSTIETWETQLREHVIPGHVNHAIYYGNSRKRLAAEGLHRYDVILTTYETLVSDQPEGPLRLTRWHRVVLDEAHRIRSRSSQVFTVVCALSARNRWCLTGTPIHNSLDDYGALLAFVGVEPLTTKPSFDRWVTAPMKNETPRAIQKLQALVQATCLRRTKRSLDLALALPPRTENCELLSMDHEHQRVYDFFRRHTYQLLVSPSTLPGRGSFVPQRGNEALKLINVLRLVCNHGQDLLSPAIQQVWVDQRGLELAWSGSSCCMSCGSPISSASSISSRHGEASLETMDGLCGQCVGRENAPMRDEPTTTLAVPASAKVRALVRNLREQQKSGRGGSGDKSVIFSYWTKMLDLVQAALKAAGFLLVRIDGKTSLKHRVPALKRFRTDPKCIVMLASLGTVGEGVDLTAANHVHVLEPHWNPMVEAQAIDRVHRLGQKKDVFVTRYTIQNSIEDYVRWVQQDKLRLISMSLDEAPEPLSVLQEQRWQMMRNAIAGPEEFWRKSPGG